MAMYKVEKLSKLKKIIMEKKKDDQSGAPEFPIIAYKQGSAGRVKYVNFFAPILGTRGRISFAYRLGP